MRLVGGDISVKKTPKPGPRPRLGPGSVYSKSVVLSVEVQSMICPAVAGLGVARAERLTVGWEWAEHLRTVRTNDRGENVRRIE